MATIDSNKRTIGELLSLTNPPIVVPPWQRSYSWTSREVESFWLDLTGFSDQYPDENVLGKEYFLGSIVLVHRPGTHLLLDGQQRAATATILLSVIRDFLNEYRGDAGTRVAQRYLSDFDDASETHRFKLTLNDYDRDFFRAEIQEQSGPAGPPVPTVESHGCIRDAKSYFRAKFEEKYQQVGRGEAAFRWALRIQRVLTDHFAIVVVTSDDEDSAASVFETLNDRGIGLSTPDLLRNLLLRRAPAGERAEIVECWREILEGGEEAPVEEFLRHYWLSRAGDIKTRRLYREIKDHIEAANTQSLAMSRDLRNAAVEYRNLVSARHPDSDASESLEGIRDLGAQALLPAIMSANDVYDLDGFKRLLRALLAFFIRHNVVGRLENSKLETVAYKLAKSIRSGTPVGDAIRVLVEAVPSLDQFERQFATVSVTRQKSASYVLRELERATRATEELEVAPPSKVHLEHIYPQRPSETRWTHHEQLVNRLGNLTLLSKRLNQSIGNGTFEEKRSAYASSELALTRSLEGLTEWNAAAIEARQAELASVAKEVWALPGEREQA